MEAVYIDSEPPGPSGGGIRTYLRLAMDACREAGVEARVYTHTPEAFPGRRALPIGRKPWLKWPWRPMAYRLLYHDNVLWEHARWLADELEREDAPDRVYEFADFQGYAFFALRSPALRRRCVVRVHTPAYLTLARPKGLQARLAAASLAYRERDCLMGRAQVTLPSAAFAAEKLPWLRGGLHLPNPLPPAPRGPAPYGPAYGGAERQPGPGPHILYLGRIEARKGVLTLLAGFLHLAKEDSGVSLTLVGAEVRPYADKVRRLLDQCPPDLRERVAWEPPCPPERRDALLARFQVLAVPSLWENSPYVYFEGMAAGLLCVGSATGEMKEAAEATGGLLAQPGEPGEWTKVLGGAVALARDPERLAAARAAQTAYLDERRADIPGRMLDLYRKLIEDAKEP
jgi:glycosyltransferase involved in cell wall biosynthesis